MSRKSKNLPSVRIKLEGVQTVKNCNLYVTPAYGKAEKEQTTTIGLSSYKSAADAYGV